MTPLLIVAAILAYLLVGFACAVAERVLTDYGAVAIGAWLLAWPVILFTLLFITLPLCALGDFLEGKPTPAELADRCAAWIRRKRGRS